MTAYADLSTALATANTVVQAVGTKIFDIVGEGNYRLYTDVFKDAGLYNELQMLGPSPKLRRWNGSKVRKSFRAYKSTTQVVPFEATIELKRKELLYDSQSLLAAKISAFLQSQSDAFNSISFAKLVANATGLDAVALFSASHPYATSAGAVQSNYSTNSLSLANWKTARNAGMALTGENDALLGINYDTLLCGPANTQKAREICDAKDRVVATSSSGAETTSAAVDTTAIQNVWQGSMRVVEDPNLIGNYAYYWFLLDTSKGDLNRPIALFESAKAPLHIVAMDQETSPDRFENDVYVWSVEGDLEVAVNQWATIYGNLATS